MGCLADQRLQRWVGEEMEVPTAKRTAPPSHRDGEHNLDTLQQLLAASCNADCIEALRGDSLLVVVPPRPGAIQRFLISMMNFLHTGFDQAAVNGRVAQAKM